MTRIIFTGISLTLFLLTAASHGQETEELTKQKADQLRFAESVILSPPAYLKVPPQLPEGNSELTAKLLRLLQKVSQNSIDGMKILEVCYGQDIAFQNSTLRMTTRTAFDDLSNIGLILSRTLEPPLERSWPFVDPAQLTEKSGLQADVLSQRLDLVIKRSETYIEIHKGILDAAPVLQSEKLSDDAKLVIAAVRKISSATAPLREIKDIDKLALNTQELGTFLAWFGRSWCWCFELGEDGYPDPRAVDRKTAVFVKQIEQRISVFMEK